MPRLNEFYFASSNINKFKEAKEILKAFNIELIFFKTNLPELQSDLISDIARQKVKEAFCQIGKPVIVEDDALIIPSLNGFPGPYSSYILKTIGNEGILKLLEQNRNAIFHSCIAFQPNEKKSFIFQGEIQGTISHSIFENGWGFDPIFIPDGFSDSFSELKNKNEISHRYKALENFSKWISNNPEYLVQ